MRERAEAPVDLLQERRIELGLPAQPAPFVAARLLLRRGALLGGATLSISLVLTAVLNWRGQQQQQQLEALAPLAQRLTTAETQLRRLSTNTAAVNKESRSVWMEPVAATRLPRARSSSGRVGRSCWLGGIASAV